MTLQEGTHTITLTATDSTNQVGSASISIRIFRNRPALPATLSVAPGELPFRLTNTQTAAQTVAIDNSGDGDLEWSAGADQPWIHLESASGSTPYNLDITADPTGLAVGEYSGQVTIDAPGAVNSPQVVTVDLLVQPGSITLTASGHKVRGVNTVNLSWSGDTSPTIDVYRNGALIRTVPNTGTYTDSTGDKGKARYTYKVCAAGIQNFSNEVTVKFGGPPH